MQHVGTVLTIVAMVTIGTQNIMVFSQVSTSESCRYVEETSLTNVIYINFSPTIIARLKF